MDKTLDRILESYVAKPGETAGKNQLLGAAYVVVNKDGVVYQGAAGRTAPAIDSPKFTSASFMIIASMTKLVTATCCMQLVDKGLIGLDDDVRPLVPQLAQAKILRGFVGADIPYLDDNSPNHPITLRHLLTHTSGLAYANGDPDLARWAAHTNRPSHASLAGTLAQWTVPLKFAPGTGWCYGTGVDWAGYVLQCVTGQTLGAYMAQHLFAPLGMHHSSFHRRDVGEPAVVVVPTSYRDESSGELVRGDDFPWPETFEVEGGGAGLYTTAEDYAKLLAELVQEDGGRVLFEKAETVREMFRPQLTDQQRGWLTFLTDLFYEGLVPDFKRGMPLDHGISGVINMEDEPGKRRKGSMMWGGLCNSHWFVDRQSGIAATLFTNLMPQPDQVVHKLWDELERAVYTNQGLRT